MAEELEPLAPAEAMQMYLNERRHELTDATIQAHRYRLKQFVLWCEQDGIDNLNEFSGRDIHRFRVKRRNEDDLATASMKGPMNATLSPLRAAVDAVLLPVPPPTTMRLKSLIRAFAPTCRTTKKPD